MWQQCFVVFVSACFNIVLVVLAITVVRIIIINAAATCYADSTFTPNPIVVAIITLATATSLISRP